MDKNKQIKKIPKYSIDKIAAKSILATRGLRELGLLKDKKHFTIIYTCQFCGRLINYSTTPCAFCCNFPRTKREVVIARALCSESLDFDSLLAVSKAVKDGEDLEIVIANLRDTIDDVLKNPDNNSLLLFKLADNVLNNPKTNKWAEEINNKTKIFCSHCGNKIVLADKPCLYCVKRGIEDIENKLTPIQKNIVAFNEFLLFAEKFLDFSNNKDATTELIFVSVRALNRLLENNELPDKNLKKYWRELLLQSEYFGSEKTLSAAIEIDSNAKPTLVWAEEDVRSDAMDEMIKLVGNIIYLLKT